MDNPSQMVEQNPPVSSPPPRTQAELFASDPLLSTVRIAKELWADEHAGEYVARLRKE